MHRFTFLIGLVLLLSPRANALPDFKLYREGVWEMRAGAEFYNAASNFESDGTKTSVASGNNLSSNNFSLGARWVPTSSWGLFTHVDMHSVTSTTGDVSLSGSGLSDVVVGTDFLLWKGFIDLIPELQAKFPLTSFHDSTEDIITADGDTAFTGRLLLNKKLSFARLFTSVGYKYRNENYSSLIVWNVGSEFMLSSFRIGASVEGLSPTSRNETEDRTNAINRVNGGSYLYASPSPYLINSKVWAGYVFDQVSLRAGAAIPLQGENVSSDPSFYVEMIYRFDTVSAKESEYQMPPDEPVIDDSGFKEAVDDGVDQSLFHKQLPQIEESTLQQSPPKKGPGKFQLKKKKRRKKR